MLYRNNTEMYNPRFNLSNDSILSSTKIQKKNNIAKDHTVSRAAANTNTASNDARDLVCDREIFVDRRSSPPGNISKLASWRSMKNIRDNDRRENKTITLADNPFSLENYTTNQALVPPTYSRGIKKSYGIACCRHNSDSGDLEIILVRKRYTHCFVSFVFGQYAKRDIKRLQFLFNGMTLQEKIDIMSLKFDIMWYKIWLEFPESAYKDCAFDLSSAASISNTWKQLYKQKTSNNFIPYNFSSPTKLDFYIKKKSKFESTFVVDGGEKLRMLITNSTNNDLSWEVPRGRKNKNETLYECATREFKEETGVNMDAYNIMFDVKPVVDSYTSLNVKYIHNYFLAYTSKIFKPHVSFGAGYQASEISSVKWASLDEIRYIDGDGHLHDLVRQIFQLFESKYIHNKNLSD